jgi:hypothetical protein
LTRKIGILAVRSTPFSHGAVSAYLGKGVFLIQYDSKTFSILPGMTGGLTQELKFREKDEGTKLALTL